MSLVLSELRAGVLVLTLNDASHRNILAGPLCRALTAAVTAAATDPLVHAIVITGTAPAFCAGADLNDLKAGAQGHMEALAAVYESFMTVAMSPLPTLAAVNGPAVGAGFNLALACDMRIAAAGGSFDTRFLKLGLHPGGGHVWMLLRAVGWAQTSRLLLCGRPVEAEEAQRIGLVQEVTPVEDLVSRAVDVLKIPAGAGRELVVKSKATMRLAADSDHSSAFAHETTEQAWSLRQPEFAALIARRTETAK